MDVDLDADDETLRQLLLPEDLSEQFDIPWELGPEAETRRQQFVAELPAERKGLLEKLGVFPDWELWIHRRLWPVEAAADLAIGINPDFRPCDPVPFVPSVERCRMLVREALREAIRADEAFEPIDPADLQWVLNRAELPIHPDCETTIDVIRQRYGSATNKPRISVANRDPHPKERASMLKLILGMAMACYNFDPTKKGQSTATAIRNDLNTLGLDMDDDTIRKYLDASREFRPDTPPL